jgi:hypothetical protein
MWMNQKKAAEYLCKSISWLKQCQAKNIFKEGVHYFKREGSIFYYPDRLDEWVLGLNESETDGKHLQQKRNTLSKYTDRWGTGSAHDKA